MLKKIILLLFLAIYGVEAKTQTLESIVNSYLLANGGKENLLKVKSLKAEGYMQSRDTITGELSTFQIPFTIQTVNLKGTRVDAKMMGYSIFDLVTSDSAWVQNPFDSKDTSLHGVSSEEFIIKRDNIDLLDPFVNSKERGIKIEFLGKESIGLKEYFKLKIISKYGNEKIFFINTKSFLADKAQETVFEEGKKDKKMSDYLDYRTLDVGIKVPFVIKQKTLVIFFNKIQLNTKIDENIFNVR